MTSDAREMQAREAHQRAQKAQVIATQHRTTRDQLVVQLRASNPEYYTHSRLAKIVRCSPELIAHILRSAKGW